MRPTYSHPSPTEAILAIAEIKATADAFDRGDVNVYDAIDTIIVAINTYQGTARPEPRRDAA